MSIALVLQAIFGFAMSGAYTYFAQPSHIAGFAVMYGIFLSFGEMGPGNCLGLLASKSSPTAFRGVFYGGAAAIGKIGAFAGTWAFPAIIDAFPVGPKQDSGPFWIGSGLAILSALVTFFFIPEVPANHMTNEDRLFREYLSANGFDVSLMGLRDGNVPTTTARTNTLESSSEDDIAKEKQGESEKATTAAVPAQEIV
ncbi:hypothetical protein FRB99_003995 [Tulasnella sp. 403]|nr:hypothetical protein FRB99_003995 [Tulasnella sp. 403]